MNFLIAAALLYEQRAIACSSVKTYQPFNILAGEAHFLGKTVYTEKLIRIPVYQLAVYGDIICQKLCAALFAGLVICHYSFTTFALNTAQSCDSSCVTYLSVKVPAASCV